MESWYNSNFFRMSIGVTSVGFIMENGAMQTIGGVGALFSPYLEPSLELVPLIIDDFKLMLKPVKSVLNSIGSIAEIIQVVTEELEDDAKAIIAFVSTIF